jgi:hypothetical protein
LLFHFTETQCRDTTLPLNLTLKPPQPCNVQTAMRQTVQSNLLNLQQWYKDLKDNQRRHQAQVEGSEKFPMRSAAVDFSLVVVVLSRISVKLFAE